MSNTSSIYPLGLIKSIQKGTLAITPGNSVVSGTITVTSVDITKSILTSSCKSGQSTSVVCTPVAGCTLTNATTISYSMGSAANTGAGAGKLFWQLVEYY